MLLDMKAEFIEIRLQQMRTLEYQGVSMNEKNELEYS